MHVHMHITALTHFSGFTCVCASVNAQPVCAFMCVSSRHLQWKTETLCLSPPPLSATSFARPVACCCAQARRLCVSLFLSLSLSVSYYLTRPPLKDRQWLICWRGGQPCTYMHTQMWKTRKRRMMREGKLQGKIVSSCAVLQK